MAAPSSVYIYILELVDGYYYVGRSENPDIRIDIHRAGRGALWTQLHPVVRVREVIKGDRFDEDKYVLSYMDRYGIHKVRGGSYSTIQLTVSQQKSLQSQLIHVNDLCARCGRKGHFIASCYAQTHENGALLEPTNTALYKGFRQASSKPTSGPQTWHIITILCVLIAVYIFFFGSFCFF